jgi:hypothetical protein
MSVIPAQTQHYVTSVASRHAKLSWLPVGDRHSFDRACGSQDIRIKASPLKSLGYFDAKF